MEIDLSTIGANNLCKTAPDNSSPGLKIHLCAFYLFKILARSASGEEIGAMW